MIIVDSIGPVCTNITEALYVFLIFRQYRNEQFFLCEPKCSLKIFVQASNNKLSIAIELLFNKCIQS